MSTDPKKPETSRILIVDDELSVRELLTEGLETFGYRTRMAAGADAAYRMIQEEQPHLVLSDIDMPGKTGLELLDQVKKLNPDIEVVMVTGVIDADIAINSIRQGATDYVTKPFNLEEVRIVVDRTLEKRRLVLENRAYQQELEIKVEERTRELREKKQEVERLYGELQESYESTLQALVTALDFRDNETHGHSWRVVEYAMLVACKLGLEEPELTWVRRGAILHDVGKIGVSDAILRKPGKLDAEEWEEMKNHPEMGYRMLQHIKFLEPALGIVLSHQERWDGGGYPRGLEGEEIPLGARIFAVVDTFDAMTSDRPYRPALSIEKAVEEVRTFAGTQFDPTVADAFLSIPIDTWNEIRERVHEQVMDLDEQVRRALG
jgi:response regulator RpfG family c-di-GMP phosphodiesterase